MGISLIDKIVAKNGAFRVLLDFVGLGRGSVADKPNPVPGDKFLIFDGEDGDKPKLVDKSDLPTSVALSDADIKNQYENNLDTNAFTDADKAKLVEVDLNTNDRHSHTNKTTLNKFGENVSGLPTYNGNDVDTTIAQRDVYDGLDSTDNTISLSANQGKALKDVQDVQQIVIDSKVDKVAGKQLSTNDYTNAEKTLLAQQSGINTGDQDLSPYSLVHTHPYLADSTTTITPEQETDIADNKVHANSPHAPFDAQKNSDITIAEIESVLTGEITSHTHPINRVNKPFADTTNRDAFFALNPSLLVDEVMIKIRLTDTTSKEQKLVSGVWVDQDTGSGSGGVTDHALLDAGSLAFDGSSHTGFVRSTTGQKTFFCKSIRGGVSGALDYLWPGDDLPVTVTPADGDQAVVFCSNEVRHYVFDTTDIIQWTDDPYHETVVESLTGGFAAGKWHWKAERNENESSHTRLVTVGDSNTFGSNFFFTPDKQFDVLLQDRLRNFNFHAVNRGKPGDMSSRVSARESVNITKEYRQYSRNILLLSVGVNDATQPIPFSDAAFWADNLQPVIDRSIVQGFEVFVVRIPPKDGDTVANSFINAYNVLIDANAISMGYKTIDLSGAFSIDQQNWNINNEPSHAISTILTTSQIKLNPALGDISEIYTVDPSLLLSPTVEISGSSLGNDGKYAISSSSFDGTNTIINMSSGTLTVGADTGSVQLGMVYTDGIHYMVPAQRIFAELVESALEVGNLSVLRDGIPGNFGSSSEITVYKNQALSQHIASSVIITDVSTYSNANVTQAMSFVAESSDGFDKTSPGALVGLSGFAYLSTNESATVPFTHAGGTGVNAVYFINNPYGTVTDARAITVQPAFIIAGAATNATGVKCYNSTGVGVINQVFLGSEYLSAGVNNYLMRFRNIADTGNIVEMDADGNFSTLGDVTAGQFFVTGGLYFVDLNGDAELRDITARSLTTAGNVQVNGPGVFKHSPSVVDQDSYVILNGPTIVGASGLDASGVAALRTNNAVATYDRIIAAATAQHEESHSLLSHTDASSAEFYNSFNDVLSGVFTNSLTLSQNYTGNAFALNGVNSVRCYIDGTYNIGAHCLVQDTSGASNTGAVAIAVNGVVVLSNWGTVQASSFNSFIVNKPVPLNVGDVVTITTYFPGGATMFSGYNASSLNFNRVF